jgi:hypothetical protein
MFAGQPPSHRVDIQQPLIGSQLRGQLVWAISLFAGHSVAQSGEFRRQFLLACDEQQVDGD